MSSKLFGKVVSGAKNALSGNWLGLAGDVVSAIAPAVGAGLSFSQQEHLLNKQMDFQERMSNSAHQREVKDLLAAGINPLYTATGGNGASTPLGATGTQTDFANAFSSGIGNAMTRRMQRMQIQSMDFQNQKLASDSMASMQNARLIKKQADSFDKRLSAEIALMAAQGQSALASGAASSANASYTQQQTAINSTLNYYRDLQRAYGDKHPFVRNFGLFLKELGIGANANVGTSIPLPFKR
ncbi:DNA pilot protein [Sigmofec virus UA08Rod_6110]|uniref:DNA pilot protein n=1 Tax=Sigmofec virus UA08Rod_6110 TaxID=2929452 RepID=A0A976N0T2_9VIRU|nr:DNA pilot protein [Sigmofec virus UA08Rod_6110]